ncbi:MAG: IS66 family insertion sequence element accessory protein TnpA [Candidatus Cryosericum sp.]
MAQKTSKSLTPRGRFWRKHVQQWGRSGATQVQYCKEHKLSVPAFHWWRRKLVDDQPASRPRKKSRPASVPTFTEIRIPHGGEAAAYAYEIILPNRTQLRLRQNFDVQAVSALLSALGASC